MSPVTYAETLPENTGLLRTLKSRMPKISSEHPYAESVNIAGILSGAGTCLYLDPTLGAEIMGVFSGAECFARMAGEPATPFYAATCMVNSMFPDAGKWQCNSASDGCNPAVFKQA